LFRNLVQVLAVVKDTLREVKILAQPQQQCHWIHSTSQQSCKQAWKVSCALKPKQKLEDRYLTM
jgi:hypothetical protein